MTLPDRSTIVDDLDRFLRGLIDANVLLDRVATAIETPTLETSPDELMIAKLIDAKLTEFALGYINDDQLRVSLNEVVRERMTASPPRSRSR